jgi:hypothetical protein
MKTNRFLIGLMAFVLVVAIATSGYMLGYASGHTAQPAEIVVQPETKAPVSAPTATDTPAKSAVSGGNDAQSSAPPDQSLKTFWEAWTFCSKEYYGDDLPAASSWSTMPSMA